MKEDPSEKTVAKTFDLIRNDHIGRIIVGLFVQTQTRTLAFENSKELKSLSFCDCHHKIIKTKEKDGGLIK